MAAAVELFILTEDTGRPERADKPGDVGLDPIVGGRRDQSDARDGNRGAG